jgi:hypothetical protein
MPGWAEVATGFSPAGGGAWKGESEPEGRTTLEGGDDTGVGLGVSQSSTPQGYDTALA